MSLKHTFAVLLLFLSSFKKPGTRPHPFAKVLDNVLISA